MPNWRKGCCAAFLLGWFLYINWGSLRVHFAPDDMMNLAYYFRAGWGNLAAALAAPWTGFYRPVGGLFYMTLFAGFGFDPVPYHAAILVLLAASVWLTYRLATLLGTGELAAGMAALVMAYHPGLSNLYYNPGFVYDVLCLFFYLAALVYYARIRSQDRALRRGEAVVFLLLFLAALESKEMAITLPAVLAVYEWMYRRPWRQVRWLLGLAAGLDAVSVAGKLFGAGALIHQPGYGPEFSIARLIDFQRLMLSDVFTCWHYSVWPIWIGLCLAVWLCPLIQAAPAIRWRASQSETRPSGSVLAATSADSPKSLPAGLTTPLPFCWLFSIAIAPLPIEFLKGRGAACLAIPAVGLAIFSASLVVALARLARRRELMAVVLIAVVCLWARRIHYLKSWLVEPAMARLGQTGWQVIGQFRALNPRVKPGSRVVFLHDPSPDLETASIAQLWFHDRTVEIRLQRQNPLPPEELAKADDLFDFEDGKLVRVK